MVQFFLALALLIATPHTASTAESKEIAVGKDQKDTQDISSKPESAHQAEKSDSKKQFVLPSYSCYPKKRCYEMDSCEEARYHYSVCGNQKLDRDKDGIPCEKLCGRG